MPLVLATRELLWSSLHNIVLAGAPLAAVLSVCVSISTTVLLHVQQLSVLYVLVSASPHPSMFCRPGYQGPGPVPASRLNPDNILIQPLVDTLKKLHAVVSVAFSQYT